MVTLARGFTPRLPQRATEQKLDLPVQAPQIVVRPPLDLLQQRWIDPEQERFAFSHFAHLPTHRCCVLIADC
jgi:hypothetical protein